MPPAGGATLLDMADHYKVLEVQPTASPEVVEKAYRALCLKHHPDRQPADGHDRATRKMQQLNESYRVLSDPALRRRYDAAHLKELTAQREKAEMLDVFLDDGVVGLFKSWIKQGMK